MIADPASHKPWLSQYHSDTPHHLPAAEYMNLAEFIEKMVERYGELPAFSNFNTSLSFQTLLRRAKAFAAYLQQELGYQKGDRLALMMPNILQYPVVLYACYLSGIAVVNINPLYTARELKHQLKDSGARGIVIVENFAHTFAQVQSELPQVKDVIITRFGDEHHFLKAWMVNFVVKYVRKLIQPFQIERALSYKEIMAKGMQLSFQPVEIAANDIAMLQYTGGTTGVAKGAMLSHANLLANIAQVKAWVGSAIKEPSLICITPLPLYHIFCCTVNALCFPSLGMHNILVTDPRDMKSFIGILKRYPFTVMTGLNTLFKGLLNQKDFAQLDFSKVRFVVSGGMPLEKIVSEQWQKVTGNVMIEGYGLTETSPIVCANLLENKQFTDGIGYPMPDTEISIRDNQDNPLPVDEAGELWVRGPQVMIGYWNQTEESQKALTADGWFKTGDIARMNAQGFVKIVDRKKDMILVSGFNVYPNEVEAVLSEHPAVHECAVISVKHSNTGEAVKAFIVAKGNQQISEHELREFAKQHLTNYKRPKIYEFIDELPKSNVGKVLRRKLSESERQKNSE